VYSWIFSFIRIVTGLFEGLDCMSENYIGAKHGKPISTYHEKKIGKKIYRITSTYKGEFELSKALEDLIVRKILQEGNSTVDAAIAK